MSGYILVAAAIILASLVLSRVSGKLGVPTLALFILLGMTFGSDGLLKIHFDDFVITEKICTIALIFIMFYGGFGTSWKQARPVAVQAALLSTLGVALTAGFVALFSYYILGIELFESMLIGAVISSTDAASVFSILRSKKLGLRYGTASMLEVESGSNDPCSYMLTILVLSMMKGDFSGDTLLIMIVQQFAVGIALGAFVGVGSAWLLRQFKMEVEGFDAMLAFGMALVAYAGADYMGGNGYLSVYIFGIILGNQPIRNKNNLVHFFDGATGLMQILLFFLLGLLSFPSQLPSIFLPALGLAIFLTFVARPLAVFAILTPFRASLPQQLLVSWTGLRGAASIVFAIMATVNAPSLNNDVFHITFFIVLFSIFLQGSLIPFFSKVLGMIDPHTNVMKTFSDYTEEIPLQCIKIAINPAHPWAHEQVKNICPIPGLLLAMILRDEKKMVPSGESTILPGDAVVITAMSANAKEDLQLAEVSIDKDHAWIGHTLQALDLGKNTLVIAVQRNNSVLIPNGQTHILEGDVLLIRKED